MNLIKKIDEFFQRRREVKAIAKAERTARVIEHAYKLCKTYKRDMPNFDKHLEEKPDDTVLYRTYVELTRPLSDDLFHVETKTTREEFIRGRTDAYHVARANALLADRSYPESYEIGIRYVMEKVSRNT
jgi:hypothetical protein